MNRQWSADSVFEAPADSRRGSGHSSLDLFKPRRHRRRQSPSRTRAHHSSSNGNAGAGEQREGGSTSALSSRPNVLHAPRRRNSKAKERSGESPTSSEDGREKSSLASQSAGEESQYSSTIYAAGPSSDVSDSNESSDESSTDTEVKRFSWDVSKKAVGKASASESTANPKAPRSTNKLPATTENPVSSTFKSHSDTPEGLEGSSAPLHPRPHPRSHAIDVEIPQTHSFHRRANLAVEVALLVGASLFASGKLLHTDVEALTGSAIQLAILAFLSLGILALHSHYGQSIFWATEARHYRDAKDQGVIEGFLMGPLLSAACLLGSYVQERNDPQASIQHEWLVYPLTQATQYHGLGPLSTARKALLSVQSVIFTVNATHMIATILAPHPWSLPQGGWARLSSFSAFAFLNTTFIAGTHLLLRSTSIGLWSSLATWEICLVCLLYQASIYTISRLAKKNFTFGELTVVAVFGVTLMLEAAGLTFAKFASRTKVLHTFRTPNSLLVFQLALIVGAFSIGFLNSPLLYLSRSLAQRPTHRLRWPQKRDLHRRLLSGFFFLFAAAFIFGVLGLWVRWLLKGHNPWMWTFRFIVQGQRWWTRPLLIVYWVALVSSSVATWQTIVVRAKRHHQKKVSLWVTPASNAASGFRVKQVSEAHSATPASNSSANGIAANTSTKSDSTVSGPLRKATHLSLNARRKFFHALAVLMFIPGIMFEPDFTHLALSLAFAIFIFAEYIRYFALFPLGAPLHIFLSEFLDHKDSGPVILSHFYLLSGCALPLWLQGHSLLLKCSGVLILGIGDALASIIGRRFGRLHWPLSSKTMEGSLAFISSIFLCGLGLHSIDPDPTFQPSAWFAAVVLLGVLEGVSEQNDNLILPVFAFSICSILNL